MFRFLLSLINPAKAIAESLAEVYVKKQNAQTEQQRIQADIEIAQLEARRQALTQGQLSWVSKVVQALWALPFIIYLWKLIVWDKVLKLGVTDALGQYELNVGTAIVGFYFLTQGIKSIIRR